MENVILQFLKTQVAPLSAGDLVKLLQGQGHSEPEIRRALWKLINSTRVVLNWDRKIVINEGEPSHA